VDQEAPTAQADRRRARRQTRQVGQEAQEVQMDQEVLAAQVARRQANFRQLARQGAQEAQVALAN